MIFTFGNYTLDIDVVKTRRIYRELPTVGQECGCDGCLNFEKAVDGLPEQVRSFFDALGVDLKKIAECYVNYQAVDGGLFYGGFCHICGTLVRGESAWVKTSETHSFYNPDLSYHLNDHFCVSFQKECYLIDQKFEAPILQLEFQAEIPWVLDKENTYPQCT